jgi:hypothetical protein
MNEQRHRRPSIGVETLTAEFQALPTKKRHLYFYIFLVLFAILGDTIKRATTVPRPDAMPSINDAHIP